MWLFLLYLATGSLYASPPPVITAQPTNQSVPYQGNVTFSVSVSSSTTVNYQWYFNSNVIGGATNSSYTKYNLDYSDAGTYYVAVTNGGGGLLSTNATLTVTVPVRRTSTPSPNPRR